jgi:glycine cleavage system aminomethyltransferase T
MEKKEIGHMTSLVTVPELSASLSLAMIQRNQATVGNSVLANGTNWTILRHA